jgi:hypothetical protein
MSYTGQISPATLQIAAEAERTERDQLSRKGEKSEEVGRVSANAPSIGSLPAHQFSAKADAPGQLKRYSPDGSEQTVQAAKPKKSAEEEIREECADWVAEGVEDRRIYRGRTIAMLRRYMRYSIETGRLPSLLGREFFRAKVTSYSVVTFEDRVIFVHDMDACLDQMEEFSRQLIARHILQEHDRWETARLLHCNEKTVRRLMPLALDQLTEILLEMGLMEKVEPIEENSCQGGRAGKNPATDCEKDK